MPDFPSSPPLWRLAVPTLVTLGNATCGFAAVLQMTSGAASGLPVVAAMTTAAWLIQGGWIFDMCDGMIARMMKVNGPFGAQLDSLCDVLTFGFAPALLVATHVGGWFGWLAGLSYLWAAIIRLARFTVDNGNDPEAHMYFSGLPSPAAAALVAGIYLSHARLLAGPGSLPGLDTLTAQSLAAELSYWLPYAAIVVSLLMVSRIRYADMPKHYLKGTKPRWHLVVVALSAWYLGPAVTIAVYFSGYLLVGMLKSAWRRAR